MRKNTQIQNYLHRQGARAQKERSGGGQMCTTFVVHKYKNNKKPLKRDGVGGIEIQKVVPLKRFWWPPVLHVFKINRSKPLSTG